MQRHWTKDTSVDPIEISDIHPKTQTEGGGPAQPSTSTSMTLMQLNCLFSTLLLSYCSTPNGFSTAAPPLTASRHLLHH